MIVPSVKPILPSTSTLGHENMTTESPQKDESMRSTFTMIALGLKIEV